MARKPKIVKELNKKHKGFNFELNEQILSLEVKLPFRIMEVDSSGSKHCNDTEYHKIQSELRRRLYSIDNTKTITIVDCGYIQYYTSNIEAIDLVIEHIKSFITEKTEQYGKYIKAGIECNKELLDELGISESIPEAKVEKRKKRVGKPVLQFSLNGEFIKEWNSANEAAKAVSGVYGAVGNIYQCCIGNYKKAYGYIWKYKENS